MTKINADDLLAVFVGENPRDRTDAMERLIEAAWRRGFADALRAHGLSCRYFGEEVCERLAVVDGLCDVHRPHVYAA
jgi:hypothetical protein